MVIRWRLSNSIIYNLAKTKAILFFKAYCIKAKKKITDIKLVFKE